MIVSKRRIYLPIFFFTWLLFVIPFSALSQEEPPFVEPPPIPQADAPPIADETFEQPASTPLTPIEDPPVESSQFSLLPGFDSIISPGNIDLSPDAIEQVYQFQLNKGVRNFTTFTTFLLSRCQQAIEGGDGKEAVALAQAAVKMAPDFPQPHWALSRALWVESKANVFAVIREYFKGYSVAFRNLRSVLLLVGNLYFLVCLAFLLSIAAFAVIVVGKYFRLLVHDVHEFLTERASGAWVAYVWAGALVLLPVLLGLGPILIACYWLIVFAVYVSKKEKQVIWVFFLLSILLPWHFGNGASMILSTQTSIVNLLHRANYEDWSPEVVNQLEAWLIEYPQDAATLFSLGLMAKRDGNFEKAEGLYEELLDTEATDDKVMGNLGNLYLAMGDAEKAKETYEKALKINANNAALHYNLYRTYLELYEFLEAREKQQLEIARKLDPETIDRQEKIFAQGVPNRMVIDQTLSVSEIWDRVFTRTKEREVLASALWYPFLNGISYRLGIFVFIALCILISFLFFQEKQKKVSSQCHKCGIPMKKRGRSKQLLKLPDICFHCLSIFFEKRKIDQRVKETKEKQVKKFQSRQDFVWRILTYALPGGGHLWIGAPGLAVLFLFVFFCLVLKVIFWNGILKDPLSLYTSTSIFQIVVFLLFALLFYLFVVWHSFRKKERMGDYVQIFQAIREKSQQKESPSEDRERTPKDGLPSALR